MSVDGILAALPDKDRRDLAKVAQNAFNKLRDNPKDDSARRVLLATDAEFLRRFGEPDGWSKTAHGEPRLRQSNGIVIATVRRLKTHNSSRKFVWVAEVRGEEFQELFHKVDQARHEVEAKLNSGENQ